MIRGKELGWLQMRQWACKGLGRVGGGGECRPLWSALVSDRDQASLARRHHRKGYGLNHCGFSTFGPTAHLMIAPLLNTQLAQLINSLHKQYMTLRPQSKTPRLQSCTEMHTLLVECVAEIKKGGVDGGGRFCRAASQMYFGGCRQCPCQSHRHSTAHMCRRGARRRRMARRTCALCAWSGHRRSFCSHAATATCAQHVLRRCGGMGRASAPPVAPPSKASGPWAEPLPTLAGMLVMTHVASFW